MSGMTMAYQNQNKKRRLRRICWRIIIRLCIRQNIIVIPLNGIEELHIIKITAGYFPVMFSV
jgi:hypothetical protein